MSLSWLFPIGATGMIALGAIIVLHMRHRMPGIVTFPQLAFWPRVPSESRDSPRWRRPPLTLLFLLQLLAALLLVLAFMRPAMPDVAGFVGQRANAVQHVIVLDGSTSMLARDGTGRSRWDVAREEVDAILGDWQQGDGVTLIVASGDPTWRRAADDSEIDALKTWLESLPVPGGVPASQQLSALIGGVLLPDLSPQFSLVTDGGLSLEADAGDVQVIRIGESTLASGNVAVLNPVMTGSASTGDRTVQVTVLHDRPSTETLPWVAKAGSNEIATGTITLGSGERDTFEVAVPDGVERMTVGVVVDDALPEDDTVEVLPGGGGLTGISIILVSDLPGPLQHALEVLPGARVEVYPSTTPGIRAIAAGADLVVYDRTAPAPDDVPTVPILLVQPTGLEGAWQLGGVVPDPQVGDVRLDDPVMQGVSLVGVTFGETPQYRLAQGAEEIASGEDGETTLPLIWRGAIGSQPYIAYAFDPDRSNIADRVSFPILIAQTVDDLAGGGEVAMVAPGTSLALDVPAGIETVTVTDPDGEASRTVLDPERDNASVVSAQVLAVPGSWHIAYQRKDGEDVDAGEIIVNVGDPVESRLSATDVIDLSASTVSGDEAGGNAATESLTELWPVLLVASIVVICLEWWLWLGRSTPARQVAEGRQS